MSEHPFGVRMAIRAESRNLKPVEGSSGRASVSLLHRNGFRVTTVTIGTVDPLSGVNRLLIVDPDIRMAETTLARYSC